MSQNNPTFRMSLLAASIALSLMTAGCGGAADTTAAVTEAAVAGADATTLTLEETNKRRRELTRLVTNAWTPITSATTIPTTTASTTTASTPTASTPTASTPTASTTTASAPIATAPTTTTTTTTGSGDTITGPLIQSSNIVYQGVFALPTGGSSVSYDQATLGSSRFGYGASAMTAYRDPVTKKLTLLISGHVSMPGHVAQVEVPDKFESAAAYNYGSIPTAKLLQKFRDITNGDLSSQSSTLGFDSNGASPRGLLVNNDSLIFSAVNWYSYNQKASHGRASLNFTENLNWSGFSAPNGSITPIRAVAGALANIPDAWRSALGSSALTGGSSVSVISTASFGPALTGFEPNSVGNGSNFPANTLLFYPNSNPVCGTPGCDNTDNPIFNWGSTIRGFAPIPKTNSILFVGTHPIGGYWYGGMTGPNGMQELPENQWQGPHSTAYEYRVWAYRASDLESVKAGKLKPWDVKPYAILPLNELTLADRSGRISGSTFDQESNLLFVATPYKEAALLHVYKISPQ
jgi:hypothetical protein